MKVFILGNGFDLQHHFPTKYINFLNVVNYLKNHYSAENTTTVGDVFSSKILQEKDKWIAECYLEHESIYTSTKLDCDKVQTLIEGARENCWFKYFSTCFDQDKGWIDFEKGVADVIEAFRSLFYKITPIFTFMSIKNREKEYICSRFDFFYDLSNSVFSDGPLQEQAKKVKEDYLIEKLSGSNIIEVDKKKIISKLHEDLRKFAKLLQLYLDVFVEATLIKMKEQTHFPVENIYWNADSIISFNYTSTFACLYDPCSNVSVGHVHGTILKDIVLGVNPDKYDEMGDLDTSFIQFKKYYQRVFLKADESYLKNEMIFEDSGISIELHISGHSLDVTDSDILERWIKKADNIVIYYHDESAVGGYIENLISMFGKSKFDSIRRDQKLKFIKHKKIEFSDEGWFI